MNDTVIVFDRIRDHFKKRKRKKVLVNASITNLFLELFKYLLTMIIVLLTMFLLR
jgi:preprotein translocase subunit SecF